MDDWSRQRISDVNMTYEEIIGIHEWTKRLIESVRVRWASWQTYRIIIGEFILYIYIYIYIYLTYPT